MLVSTQSETVSECHVIFVAVVHRMGKNDWNIGIVLFWLFKLYILRKSENVCLMAPVTRDSSAEMHVKHQTSKSVFPLILFTQQDSSCSTIAAEEGERIQVWTDDRNCFSARSSNLSPLVFYLWSLNHSLCPKNIRPDLWYQCNSNIIKMHC